MSGYPWCPPSLHVKLVHIQSLHLAVTPPPQGALGFVSSPIVVLIVMVMNSIMHEQNGQLN